MSKGNEYCYLALSINGERIDFPIDLNNKKSEAAIQKLTALNKNKIYFDKVGLWLWGRCEKITSQNEML